MVEPITLEQALLQIENIASTALGWLQLPEEQRPDIKYLTQRITDLEGRIKILEEKEHG